MLVACAPRRRNASDMVPAAGISRAILTATIVLGLLATGPARADTGRIAFTVGLPAPAHNVDVTGATSAAARPDGGAILVGDEPGRGFVAAAIDSDGALDEGFGLRGVSHVRVGK